MAAWNSTTRAGTIKSRDAELRAYAPVTLAREVVEETSIGACHFKQGEMAMLPFPGTNRDPAIFENAAQVVLDCAENRHMAFCSGIHRCIGSHLARMETVVALQEWLPAMPDFELVPGAPRSWSSGAVRGPRTLPLVLGGSGGRVVESASSL
jgi:cytochrome P450